jgi:hypothetical protein
MNVEASQPFEAVYAHGGSGLVGTLEVALIDNDGNTVLGPTTLDIGEQIVGGTPTGIYVWNAAAAPAITGQYSIVWSPDGTFDAATTSVDELVVVPVGSSTLPSIPTDDGFLTSGPCSAWATTADVVACCNAPGIDVSDTSLIEASIVAASQVLYEASGRQFVGVCETTVRPCQVDDCMCGTQVLSRGHLVGWNGECWGGYSCGCRPEPRVKLAGYVREITEVKIDGVVVDPALYRVDKNRFLVRTDGDRWPSCQTIELDDTEEGTFAISYTYGKIPPLIAQQAAQQLACEIFKACPGSGDVECAIPSGVVRITRQGITIERGLFARDRDGNWSTGLGIVDFFLNTFNPSGIPRRATIWSPSRAGRYARRVG